MTNSQLLILVAAILAEPNREVVDHKHKLYTEDLQEAVDDAFELFDIAQRELKAKGWED